MFGFSQQKLPEVTAEEIEKVIATKEDATFLDVRTTQEFQRGHLSGSINLPLDEIASRVEQVLPDKNAKVYVYCFSGSRSVHAVRTMVEKGYTQVYNIKSGVLALRSKNLTFSL